MRLYLSSYRLGRHSDILLDLIGENRSCIIVGNALDHYPAAARAIYKATVYDPVVEMKQIGINAKLLDLRDYFNNSRALYDRLYGSGLIWVLGGNSFLLRRAMRLSGFDKVIRKLLHDDKVVYGGFSAGAIVTGSTLDGLHLMDDPDVIVAGYQSGPIWEGLSLYPEPIVPHYASDHREAAAADKAIAYLVQKGTSFTKLSDGEVITVNGGERVILR